MKKISLSIVLVISSLLLLNSCASLPKQQAFPKMYEENPLVFLIMPPINNSSQVDAKDYFYTTMCVPIAEAGYYVLPPMATLSALQNESAYDSERFIDGDLKALGNYFGADVAVFTIIKAWDKQVIGSTICIEIEYIFKSTKTNEILYNRDATIRCNTSSSYGNRGLLDVLISAIKTAVIDYVSIAVMCNESALDDIPYGKYHPSHGLDKEESANPKKISISVSK